MPNHVTHRAQVSGQDLDQFFNECFIDDKFDFNTLVPMPVILEDTVSGSFGAMANERNFQAIIETGYSNWYDWSIACWGTKWNAYNMSIEHRSSDYMEFIFDTAWSPPTPIFQAIANKYKELEVNIKAFDEGWNFAYQVNIKNGVFKEERLEADEEIYEFVYGEPPDLEEEDD